MNESKVSPIIRDVAWSKALEEEYEQYQASLYEHIDWVEGEPDPTPTLSGEPFCGCDTCWTREQIYFMVPYIITGYLNGKVGIKFEE
jgi:hypothetical protein